MDVGFLLFLAMTLLIMGCVASTCYYLGKQSAYVEMFARDMDDRDRWVKDMVARREREENDGSSSDHHVG